MSAATGSACCWLAVADHRSGLGYTLETWPGERLSYQLVLGNAILGEFESSRAAEVAVTKFAERRLNGIPKAKLK